MSRSKALPIPGEFPRMVVRDHPVAPSRSLVLIGLRVLTVLGLLALVPLYLGSARALEGAQPTGKVSGMNPGPFPKPGGSAKSKPAADGETGKVAGAAKPEPSAAPAESAKPTEIVRVAEVAAPPESAKPPAPAPKQSAYCASIADAAADARFAWQKEQLAALEKQVEARIAQLETKRGEYEFWLARRNAFLAKADEGVVAIYTKMRADAAALQLANMPDESAAAILTKLNARTASAILSEMEAARAAQLARMMTDVGKDVGKKARESEKS